MIKINTGCIYNPTKGMRGIRTNNTTNNYVNLHVTFPPFHIRLGKLVKDVPDSKEQPPEYFVVDDRAWDNVVPRRLEEDRHHLKTNQTKTVRSHYPHPQMTGRWRYHSNLCEVAHYDFVEDWYLRRYT